MFILPFEIFIQKLIKESKNTKKQEHAIKQKMKQEKLFYSYSGDINFFSTFSHHYNRQACSVIEIRFHCHHNSCRCRSLSLVSFFTACSTLYHKFIYFKHFRSCCIVTVIGTKFTGLAKRLIGLNVQGMYVHIRTCSLVPIT